MDYDGAFGQGVIFVLCFSGIVAVSMLAGAAIAEGGNIQEGRNKGILFCIENQKQCMTEYNYLKLKQEKK